MSKPRRQAIGVALFPFLAVLICTMGALIVLLVLLVQQASLDAREIGKERARQQQPADPHAAERKVAKEKVEDEEWRRGILESQRTERVEELNNARLKVSHLADHIRRLQEQAQMLIARAQEIDRGEASKSPDLTAEQTELNKLQAEIARRKLELEAKKKELAAKERSYALIPYDGPNGTKRRPIYIECTKYGVVLQPEGLILGPQDFSGPLNPGNPLDAGIRAIREAWTRSGTPGEPYPLLVVRPDGIVAYQYARQALRGYDDEFGYELVGDEKKLDFGPPNPAMQRVLEQVVGSARERQVQLAAAMPRKFQNDDTVVSFVAEDQPTYQEAVAAAGGNGGGGNGPPGTGVPGGTGFGAGAGGTGLGGNGNGNFPGINSQFSASNNRVNAIRAGQGSGTGTGVGGMGTGAGGTGGGGSGVGGSGVGSTGTSAASGVNGGYASGNSANGGAPSGAAGGTAGGSANGQMASGQAGGSTQYGAARPGSGQFIGNSNPGGAGQGSTASAGGQSGGGQAGSGQVSSGQPGGSAGGQSSTDPQSPNQNQNVSANIKPRAQQRAGNNWGLPGAMGKTTAVTRPVKVLCLPDRLVVVPEKGDDRAASVIGVSPQLQPAEVDAFVAAVQKHLTSWGPAMVNGYWKPVLKVEVTRGAEAQFETLSALLQGSGFEIQRNAP